MAHDWKKGKEKKMSSDFNIGLPDRMTMNEYDDYLHITRKWFSTKALFLTAFAVVWNGAMINYYQKLSANADLMAWLFPSIHLMVGIGVAYFALALWMNHTNIFVSAAALEIQHKPLLWRGNKRIQSTDIKQLYCKEHISRSNNSTSVSYAVHGVTHSGRNFKLLTGLDTSEQALYVEQEIERYLGIENTHVRGSIS